MYFCEAGIIFDFSEHVERLDYSVTVPSVSGLETAHYFVEHPVYGTTGYPTYEDACEDMHGILGFGQFLDTVESMIQAGFVGDHYIFDSQNMLVKVRSDYEYWTWTPETGLVYDPEPEPEYPNRKQRRSARRVQNARHKKSDRAHGKRHGDKYLNSLSRKKYLEADNYDHPTFRVEKGKLRPIHDVKRERETAKVRDAMDVSEIERLTASVLAEVQQYHGMVGCTWNVFYLSEAICRREQLPYPDYAYVREQKGKCKLILEYVEYDHEDYTTYEYFDLRI